MSLGSATFDIKADVSDLTAGFAKARGEIDKLIVMEKQLSTTNQHLTHSARTTAYGLMQLGNAVDDLQYGFSAIVNNITPIVYGFTGSMGIAAGAQIAAVGINLLIQHVGDLRDIFQGAWLGVPVEHLTELRKRADEAAEGFDKLTKVGTKLEQKGAKGIEEAITEGPIGRVLDFVTAGVAGDKGMRAPLTAADKASILRAREIRKAQPAEAAARLGAIRERLDQENRTKAAQIISDARLMGEKGAVARGHLGRFANENPKGAPPGFLGDIMRMDPAELAKQAELDKQGEHNAANMTNKFKRKQEEEKRVHDAREALAKAQDQQERADDQHRKERERQAEQDARKAVQFNRQMRQLFKMGKAPEEGQSSQWVEGSQFAKFGQTTGLNAYADEQKRQTRVLERIRELIEDDPMNKFRIAGRLAGIAARAAEPN